MKHESLIIRGSARICIKGGKPLSVIIGEKKHGHLINPHKSDFIQISAPCCRYLRHYLVMHQQKRNLSAHYVVLTGFCYQGRSQTCDRKKQRVAIENVLILRNICENLIISNEFFWENLKKIWKILKSFEKNSQK